MHFEEKNTFVAKSTRRSFGLECGEFICSVAQVIAFQNKTSNLLHFYCFHLGSKQAR